MDNFKKLILKKDTLLEKQDRIIIRQQELIEVGLKEIEDRNKLIQMLEKQVETADKMISSFAVERKKWEELTSAQNSLIEELNELIERNRGKVNAPSAN